MLHINWAASRENTSSPGHMRTAKPRLACASAQCDQGIPCPLTKALDTTDYEYMNGEQRPG